MEMTLQVLLNSIILEELDKKKKKIKEKYNE